MMKKIKAAIKNSRGMSYIETAVLVLVIAMMFSLVFEYAEIMAVMTTMQEDSQRVLDSLVIKNAVEIFASIKNGHTIMDVLSHDDYKEDLCDEMGLIESSGKFYRGSVNRENCVLEIDSDFNVSNEDDRLNIKATFWVYRPIHLAGKYVTSIRIRMGVTSIYTKKSAYNTGEPTVPAETTTGGPRIPSGGEELQTAVADRYAGTTVPQRDPGDRGIEIR